ncbi:MAG: hypothetical protein Ct9H300mP30_3860 [Methanobacteriota archaeon]|nr:MAG: hypothetical protein Ct9H300mP30_3860 [Euryarchaeota archaeon]
MPAIGDTAPDFTLTAHDKSSVTLSEMRGTGSYSPFFPRCFHRSVPQGDVHLLGRDDCFGDLVARQC